MALGRLGLYTAPAMEALLSQRAPARKHPTHGVNRPPHRPVSGVSGWQAFTALCGYLRSGLLGEPVQEPDEISWELLIEASSYHNVTPALAWCLRHKIVPADVREYLDTVLVLNGKRNEALLTGLARIVAALNAIDISPALLKGAARLVEGSYPAPTLRFLGDLDLLVPAERLGAALDALESAGFQTNKDDSLPPTHHHLPMLYEAKTGIAVELHADVMAGVGAAIIPTGWFWQGTKLALFRDLQIRLPDPTRSAGHTIAHDQVAHWGYHHSRVDLRSLLDLAIIRRASERAIDWTHLDERFCSVGFGRALSTYLKFAETLLGQASPALRQPAHAGIPKYFRRVIEPPPTWQQPITILVDEIGRWRRSPRRALDLMDSSDWSKHFRRVRQALKLRSRSW